MISDEYFMEIPEVPFDQHTLRDVVNYLTPNWVYRIDDHIPAPNNRFRDIRYADLFKDYPYVRELANRFLMRTHSKHAWIIEVPANFAWPAHKDTYTGRRCSLVFSLSEDGEEPIQWVDDSGQVVMEHRYSSRYPTLINVQRTHQVKASPRSRVALHLGNYTENYEIVLARHRAGEFIR